MVNEMLTLKGESDGTSTSGDFPLYSDIIYYDETFPPPTKIIIPFGMKAKIWSKRFAAEGETLFQILFSKDATVASPSWDPIDAEKLASKGEISLEKRRPIVLRSVTGKEGFKVSWLQPTAVKAFVDLEVEFTDE
jgi:hypothetical protein